MRDNVEKSGLNLRPCSANAEINYHFYRNPELCCHAHCNQTWQKTAAFYSQTRTVMVHLMKATWQPRNIFNHYL